MERTDTPRLAAMIARHTAETVVIYGDGTVNTTGREHAVRQITEILALAADMERELSGFVSELAPNSGLEPSGAVVLAMVNLRNMKAALVYCAEHARPSIVRDVASDAIAQAGKVTT